VYLLWNNDRMDLEIGGLRVMVSAGANGIGLENARAFVREGARVHVCDVDAAAIARLAASDPTVTASICDVSDRKQVERFFEECLAKLGGLDCLVNNAGIAGPTGKVDAIDPADGIVALPSTHWQFNCVRMAVPHLRKSSNASVINVSSLCGRLGFALRTPRGMAGVTASRSPRHRVRRRLDPRECPVPGVVAGTPETSSRQGRAGSASRRWKRWPCPSRR
jgi:NAD(P)-dependent dehydrogenase (short-subunit alcohol dehydrogenase family)